MTLARTVYTRQFRQMKSFCLKFGSFGACDGPVMPDHAPLKTPHCRLFAQLMGKTQSRAAAGTTPFFLPPRLSFPAEDQKTVSFVILAVYFDGGFIQNRQLPR